jgi:Tfp pilus assembly protein PilO
MIVSRKPCTLYDVDVIGIVVLVVIALAACFGVVVPAGANASEYRELSAKIAAANAAADQTGSRLRRVSQEIEVLQRGVAGHMHAAPKPSALTPFLQRVASLAIPCNLRIIQVLPQPVQQAEACLTCDVSFSAQGRSLGFARLIHELSRDNPYFSLQDFSIKTSPNAAQPTYELSWTLRLYMLEDEARQPDPAHGPDLEGRP